MALASLRALAHYAGGRYAGVAGVQGAGGAVYLRKLYTAVYMRKIGGADFLRGIIWRILRG